MNDNQEVRSLMNIQEKESETYFTPVFPFTEDQKQYISSLGLYTKIMSGNRIRIYGNIDQRKNALQHLATEYEQKLFESSNTPNQRNSSFSIPDTNDSNTKKYPQQTKFQMKQEKKEIMKKYRCAGGCSATPLGW